MDLDMLGLVLAVLLGAYVFLFCFVKKINQWVYVRRLGEKKPYLPPGDMGWPVFGNMWSFLKAFKSNDPDTFIYDLVRRYGRTGIYKTHLLGSPIIIVSTPETCKKVLLDDEHFRLGYPGSTKKLTGKKIHNVPNSEHKRLRRLTTAAVTGREALAMYVGYIEDIVMNSLDEWASIKEPIELLKEMKNVTFKVITHIFLGSTADSIAGLAEKHFTDFGNGMISSPVNFPGFAFHKALKARNKLIKILQDALDERRSKSQVHDPNEKKGMIDLFMRSEDENGQHLTDEDIIALLLIFFFAGHETAAHAGMWVIIHLHQHPQVLQKAKEEQEEILKKRPITQKGLTLKDVREMNYLQKVIDETLRHSTIQYSVFREAKVDVNINGYLIPKDWKVLVWIRGVHMDPEIYPNPKHFTPKRWENHTPNVGAFLPFGAGSRICPGADLAKLEISILLHYFLLNYKFEQVNPGGPNTCLPMPEPVDNCLAKVTKIS